MALNTVLLLAAGMGVNLGFQDPAFDMQFAVPVLDQSPAVITPAVQVQGTNQVTNTQATSGTVSTAGWELAQTATVTQSKKISAQFKNTKVSEVLSWLQDQGVSFVVANGMIQNDATVTLNIVDQPADDVIDAIATALGGHWQRERGIRVYKPGPNPFTYGVGGGAFGAIKGLEPMKNFQWSGDRDFKFDSKAFEKSFGPEFQKKMEAFAKQGKNFTFSEKDFQKQFGPEFQKKMELLGKEYATKFGPEFDKDMQKKFGPEFEKQMAEHSKLMEKMSKDMEVRMKDFEKQHKVFVEKLQKDGQFKIQGDGAYQLKDGKLFKLEPGQKIQSDGKEIIIYGSGQDAKVQREIARARANEARVRADGARVRAETRVKVRDFAKAPSIDGKKFLNSLTAEQKHTQRMRGYILYIDLTKEQKEMLGNVPKGKFEIKLKVNDEEVAVRGS